MAIFSNLAQWIPSISLLLCAVVAWRLFRSGLYLKYPYFVAFLCFSVVRLLVLKLPLSRRLYAEIWMATEALLWIFYVLILLELYTLVLERYKGIQSLGKWIFHGSVGLALFIAALSLYPKLGTGQQNDFLMLFMIAERGILCALALLTLLMTAFLAWFPVPLPRNVILHSVLFAFYFFSKAAALLVRNLMGHAAAQGGTSFAILAVGWICMVLWAWLLTPDGEDTEARVHHRWNEEEEERLLDQLKLINSSLSRSTR